ncbi:MAG: hypothetical protein OEU44_08440 [Gammaproteobacteria bacterium]|nr:hypothetical protein [Gammaproteobacteria bacterium]
MFASAANVEELISNFRLDGTTFRYSSFVPRLYNYVKSLGFRPGKILPSRAFCSDENQGYPIIVLAKHFGTFPFNLGRGGAVVAMDRHAPYAEHGEGLVIIQASHVGYESGEKSFGTYSRIHAKENQLSACCGKLSAIVAWYLDQYRIAQSDILVERFGDMLSLRIDNSLLRGSRKDGLFLRLKSLVRPDVEGNYVPLHTHSTAKSFITSEGFRRQLADLEADLQDGESVSIGDYLKPEMFYFRRNLDETVGGRHQQEHNLLYPMPWIVTSHWPLLTAAQINTQVEFDRTLRTVAHSPNFRDKCVLYISGLNIDISPSSGESFPTTKFVPWAAFMRDRKGKQRIIEQTELVALLREQSKENPDQINLEDAIRDMAEAESVVIEAS